MAVGTPFHRVAIAAPDGAAALELELRLAHLSPSTISRRGEWVVDVPGVADPAEIEAVVQRWLRDIGAQASVIRVDGTPRVVACRRNRPTNIDFIG